MSYQALERIAQRAMFATENGEASEVLAIPLEPDDRELTPRQCRERLEQRLWVLMQLEESPARIINQMLQERISPSAFFKEDDDLPYLLLEVVGDELHLPHKPIRARHQPAAREAILEMTLLGWLQNVLPPHLD
jgi:hypothetical protein